jgi:hypothetical protein
MIISINVVVKSMDLRFLENNFLCLLMICICLWLINMVPNNLLLGLNSSLKEAISMKDMVNLKIKSLKTLNLLEPAYLLEELLIMLIPDIYLFSLLIILFSHQKAILKKFITQFYQVIYKVSENLKEFLVKSHK